MLLSASSVSSSPISSRGIGVFASSLAFTQSASTILISDAEIFADADGLIQPASTIAITGVWFSASIALTQAASSTNIKLFNGIAPWAPAPVVNTPIRKVAPALAQIRQEVPSLSKIRQNQPTLVE